MKLKKTLAALIAAATAVTMGASLMACGDPNTPIPDGPEDQTPPGMSTLKMEAEYIDLDDVAGAGISSNQSGLEMIYGSGSQADKDKGWSNGYYVGYTYTSECVLEFVFNSDKDTTGVIKIRLGSELGNITLTSREVEIKLNGSTVNYGTWSILDSQKDMSKVVFKDYTISNNAQIKKGENKLTLSVKQNDIGPLVDCVTITSDANLTYDAKTDNPSNKSAI